MKFEELIIILKRLFKEYIKKHLKKIFLALFLSIFVALSTSSIAWLLDPAVKKIFEEQDRTYAWAIPLAIIVAFTTKGLTLYFARILTIRVSQEICEIQKRYQKIFIFRCKDIDSRHSGKYISNIMFDPIRFSNLLELCLNLMKDSFTAIALFL